MIIFCRSHSSSLSLIPSLPPTSVAFKISNSGPSAFSSATYQLCQSFFSRSNLASYIMFFCAQTSCKLSSFVSFIFDTLLLVCLLCLPASPAFGGFYYPLFWPKTYQLRRVQLNTYFSSTLKPYIVATTHHKK